MLQGWENWRWVEQWLPHSTWFMMSASAWSSEDYKRDEPTTDVKKINMNVNVVVIDGALVVSGMPHEAFVVVNLKGALHKKSIIGTKGSMRLDAPKAHGVYWLKTKNTEVRFVVK